MSFLFGSSSDAFTDLVERATSESIPVGSDDIMLNLEVADKIKGKEVAPDKAMRAIKGRLEHKNPNVQLLALKLCDICVKNGGNHFLQQVSSREFLEQIETMLKQQTLNYDVRNKALTLIQSWALAFRSRPELSYIVDVYNRLRNSGYTFPPPDKTESSSAMIDTATAPEWTDSDVCERCRVAFSFTNRKHHCRNCGKTFCGSCSAKSEPLPHYGVTKAVRVCDGCWGRLQSGSGANAAGASPALATTPSAVSGYPGTTNAQSYQKAATAAINRMMSKEDDDLAKAIALSLEEANVSKPALVSAVAPSTRNKEDEDLERAITESLKDLEAKRATATQNVEAALRTTATNGQYDHAETAKDPNELSGTEAGNIRLFSQLVEKLEQEAAIRGAGAAVTDTSIQDLHRQIAALQPKLVKNVEDAVQKYRAFSDINTRIEGAMRTYDMMLQARLREAAYPQPSYGANPGLYRYDSYPAQTTAQYSAVVPDEQAQNPYSTVNQAPQSVVPQSSYYADADGQYAAASMQAAAPGPAPYAAPEHHYQPPHAGQYVTQSSTLPAYSPLPPPGAAGTAAVAGSGTEVGLLAQQYGQPQYAAAPMAAPATAQEEEKPLIEL